MVCESVSMYVRSGMHAHMYTHMRVHIGEERI